MYKESFVLSVLLNGHVAREENGVVKVPFSVEYGLRLKNKYTEPVAVDIYTDGQLVNEAGHIFLAGNSSLDVDQWILKDGTARKLLFTDLKDGRVAEPNESENGRIEARFYKPKKSVQWVPTTYIIQEVYPYYPVWPIYIHHHWHEPQPMWIADTNGTSYSNVDDVIINTSEATSSKAGDLANKGFDGINILEVNGATVKGRETLKKIDTNADFSLQTEPVVLSLLLIGSGEFKPLMQFCPLCGRKRGHKDLYCSKCGTKL